MIPKLIWIGAAYLLVPTGDASDLLLAPIILTIGLPLYLILVAFVLWMLWHALHGNSLRAKFNDLKHCIKGLFK